MVGGIKLTSPLNPPREGLGGEKPLTAQNVIILAKHFTPTQAQLDILNKGLTFIPTLDLRKGQKHQLKLDIQNYHRKLSLAAYFQGSERTGKQPFTPPSDWIPPKEKVPEEIHLLIEKDLKDFNKYFTIREEKSNLTREEYHAIRQLMTAKHIIIKPADKGSSVVVLDRDQYVLEVSRQLSDQVYYKKLDAPIYLETIPIIHDIVNTLKAKKFINHKQARYLKGLEEPRERRFYVLPKIHKPPETWTVPFQVPPGRPIVSDCGSETYATAEFIDFFLNPLAVLHPSYVKDTYHFIEIVTGLKIAENTFFFSLDVDSLYTNIPIAAGLETVKNIFLKYPDESRPDEEVLRLLEINLTRNDFVFDGKFYLQIKGTAMGKRFAPAYANVFMANWEEGALAKCPKKPIHYLRYLDDIWGVWGYSLADFKEFMDILNAHDPSITLKSEINSSAIDFLDTTVYKGQDFALSGKLDVKVFFKKTDTHALLFRSSFHPQHTFKGLVKSQLLRFSRICTRQEDFWVAVHILFRALRTRGYSRSFLGRCLASFREQKLVRQNKMVPLITQFSSVSRTLNHRFKENFETILGNTGLLSDYEVISAYKKNKNLKDLLVRARLKSLVERSRGHMETFCSLKYVKNSTTKRMFKLTQGFSPLTKNVVYLVFCTKCEMKYVGETKNTIRMRMWQHKYNILHKKQTQTPLVRHFISHGFRAFRIAGIQSNVTWTHRERKAKERRWIYWLDTKEPLGLNLKWQ